MGADGELSAVSRPVGTNDIGMLAWHTVMKTPEYPDGRDVVVIANDVTVQSGSFGVKEDDFFFKASEYARKHGLPRLYISCNSGARIGLVEELKPKFKVHSTFFFTYVLILSLLKKSFTKPLISVISKSLVLKCSPAGCLE